MAVVAGLLCCPGKASIMLSGVLAVGRSAGMRTGIASAMRRGITVRWAHKGAQGSVTSMGLTKDELKSFFRDGYGHLARVCHSLTGTHPGCFILASLMHRRTVGLLISG